MSNTNIKGIRIKESCVIQKKDSHCNNKLTHLTVMKERSRATRTFVSMLVLFFLRREGTPSKPREGEDRELGLGRVLSMDMVSEGQIHQHVHTSLTFN